MSSRNSTVPIEDRRNSTKPLQERVDLSNILGSGNTSDILLTRPEVSILSGIGNRKLDVMCASGQGPRPIKIGHRTIRYRASEVQDWLSELESSLSTK